MSSGLVFFYFESIDNLLVALLDWLLERTVARAQLVPTVDLADAGVPCAA